MRTGWAGLSILTTRFKSARRHGSPVEGTAMQAYTKVCHQRHATTENLAETRGAIQHQLPYTKRTNQCARSPVKVKTSKERIFREIHFSHTEGQCGDVCIDSTTRAWQPLVERKRAGNCLTQQRDGVCDIRESVRSAIEQQ